MTQGHEAARGLEIGTPAHHVCQDTGRNPVSVILLSLVPHLMRLAFPPGAFFLSKRSFAQKMKQ